MSGIHLFVGFNQKQYIPGHNVDGIVVLVVQKAIKAKSLKLKWYVNFIFIFPFVKFVLFLRRGIEFAHWTLGIRQNQTVIKKNTLFEDSIVIWEPKESDIIQKGTYTYDFVWRLPENLPLSYEGATDSEWVIPNDSIIPKFIGNDRFFIKYSATAVLTYEFPNESPEEFLHHEKFFTVLEAVKPEHLNAPPLNINESKTFLFGQDMPLKLNLVIDNGGIVFKGEKLPVKVNVNNSSKRTVEAIRFTLTSITILKSENAEETFVREDPVLKSMISGIQILPNSSFQKEVNLDIPTSCGSILSGKVVSRKYELTCELIVQMGINLLAKAEITVLERYKIDNELKIIYNEEEEEDDVFTIDDEYIDEL